MSVVQQQVHSETLLLTVGLDPAEAKALMGQIDQPALFDSSSLTRQKRPDTFVAAGATLTFAALSRTDTQASASDRALAAVYAAKRAPGNLAESLHLAGDNPVPLDQSGPQLMSFGRAVAFLGISARHFSERRPDDVSVASSGRLTSRTAFYTADLAEPIDTIPGMGVTTGITLALGNREIDGRLSTAHMDITTHPDKDDFFTTTALRSQLLAKATGLTANVWVRHERFIQTSETSRAHVPLDTPVHPLQMLAGAVQLLETAAPRAPQPAS